MNFAGYDETKCSDDYSLIMNLEKSIYCAISSNIHDVIWTHLNDVKTKIQPLKKAIEDWKYEWVSTLRCFILTQSWNNRESPALVVQAADTISIIEVAINKMIESRTTIDVNDLKLR